MEFPRIVFLSPGKHKCKGGTYGFEVVETQKEYDAAIEAGYSASIPEALEALEVAKESMSEAGEKPKRGRKAKTEAE